MRNPENQSGETGRTIERFLGGPSSKPIVNNDLLNHMITNDTLIPQSLQKKLKKESGSINKIDVLHQGLQELIDCSKLHEDTFNENQKEEIRNKMFEIKKILKSNGISHDKLEEILVRLNIAGKAVFFDPTRPYPQDEKHEKMAGYRVFGDIQEKLVKELTSRLRRDDEDEDYELIHFFPSEGNPLDIMYSTDGFFFVDGKLFRDGKTRYLPIDLTIRNKGKYKNASGSLILFVDTKLLDETKSIEDYIKEFTTTCADELIRQDGLEINPDKRFEQYRIDLKKTENKEKKVEIKAIVNLTKQKIHKTM